MNDWIRAAIVAGTLAGVTILGATHAVNSDAVLSVYTIALGYALGRHPQNGNGNGGAH